MSKKKDTCVSLTSSAGSAGSASDLNQPDLFGQSPSVSETSIAKPSLGSTGPTSQSTTMSEPSTQMDLEELTSFAAVSRVNRSQQLQPGSAKAREMTATSGRRCLELLKTRDAVGLSVKMLLESTAWRSSKWFLTWKPAATRLHRRLKFRLVPSDTIIGGRASGFSHTPTATANHMAPSMQKHPSCRGIIVTPEIWESAMGFPKGWTDIACAPSATPSSRRSSRKSGGRSSQRSVGNE